MNRKQWLVLICGLIFMGINLLFPRSFHGNGYYFITVVDEYEIAEMFLRQLTLLALLIATILLFSAGKGALNLGQKINLYVGMILWVVVYLFPPNFYGEFDNNYFAPNWDARVADYSFLLLFWPLLALYTGFLFAIFTYRAVRNYKSGIVIAIILPLILQFFSFSTRVEDRLTIDPFMLLIGSVIGLIVLGVTHKKVKLYS